MTPFVARAALARALVAHGEDVTLRRVAGLVTTNATVRARIMGWSPQELASGVMQGERKAIVSAADVEASGFPVPLRKNDALIVRGRRMNIDSIDDSTRRIGETLIAYELGVTG